MWGNSNGLTHLVAFNVSGKAQFKVCSIVDLKSSEGAYIRERASLFLEVGLKRRLIPPRKRRLMKKKGCSFSPFLSLSSSSVLWWCRPHIATMEAWNEMIQKSQKDENKWRVEMDRVETCRRIMLLTLYLQEIGVPEMSSSDVSPEAAILPIPS